MRRTRIEHMSAGLPPITDIARRDWDGRKVPQAVISQRLFDHLVGAGEQGRRHPEVKGLAVFRLITRSYLAGACTGRFVGFSPLRMRSTSCEGEASFRWTCNRGHARGCHARFTQCRQRKRPRGGGLSLSRMVLTMSAPKGRGRGANAQGGHLVSTDPKPPCLHSVSIVFRQKGKWFRRETRLWSVVWAQQS